MADERTGDEHGEFPRALTEREAETLNFMLSVSDDRLEPLRAQAAVAKVVGRCACPCASIYLAVSDETTPRAPGLRASVVSADGQCPDDAAEHYFLDLFLKDGMLDALEVSYLNDPPAEFPPTEIFGSPKLTDY